MDKKKYLFVVNPISGTTKKTEIVDVVERKLDSTRFHTEVVYTERAGHGAELAAEASDRGWDAVIAVGGDGTVNEVARALVHSRTALGIVPCGSGNGLARHLRIPLDLEKAVALLNDGTVFDLDYGLCSGQPFFCTCGVGFDAFISDRFANCGERGPKAYLENILQSGLKYKPDTYHLESEDGSIRNTAFLVTCANASQYGNNAYIAPKASMQDGLMDIILIEPFSALEAPQIALQMFNKSIQENSHVKSYHARRVTITRSQEGPVHCDGEPFWAGEALDIEIVPKGFKAIVDEKAFEEKSSFIPRTFEEWQEDLRLLQQNFLDSRSRLREKVVKNFHANKLVKAIRSATQKMKEEE